MSVQLPNEQVRQYLYTVATALAPMLIAFGVASSGTVSLILTVIGAILGVTATGTASLALAQQRNSPPAGKHEA